jgi:hypothetical protein
MNSSDNSASITNEQYLVSPNGQYYANFGNNGMLVVYYGAPFFTGRNWIWNSF